MSKGACLAVSVAQVVLQAVLDRVGDVFTCTLVGFWDFAWDTCFAFSRICFVLNAVGNVRRDGTSQITGVQDVSPVANGALLGVSGIQFHATFDVVHRTASRIIRQSEANFALEALVLPLLVSDAISYLKGFTIGAIQSVACDTFGASSSGIIF